VGAGMDDRSSKNRTGMIGRIKMNPINNEIDLIEKCFNSNFSGSFWTHHLEFS